MNQNVVIAAGAVVSLIAVGFIVLSDDSIDMKTNINAGFEKKDIPSRVETTIDYEQKVSMTSSKPVAAIQKKTFSVAKPKVKKEEKPVAMGVAVQDRSGRFIVAVVDPTRMYKPSEMPKSAYSVPVGGEVDGHQYSMYIPQKLLENPENVKVRIVDQHTGKVREGDAAFLYDIQKGAQKYTKVDFDSEEPNNYRVSEREPILRPLE